MKRFKISSRTKFFSSIFLIFLFITSYKAIEFRLSDLYVRDIFGFIYLKTKCINYCYDRVPADIFTFKPLREDLPFGIDKNTAFSGIQKIPADRATFQLLGNSHYSKDKDNIFYDYHLVKDADLETFRPVYEEDISKKGYHAQDKNHCYVRQFIVDCDNPLN